MANVEIMGNEKADHLASTGTSLPSAKKIHYPIAEMNRIINRSCIASWSQQWKALGRVITAFKPEIGPTAYSDCPRKTQVLMTRFRLGTTTLTHGHFFLKTSPRKCPKCNENISLIHLFMHCNQLNAARKKLKDICVALKLNFTLPVIFTPPMPACAILNFLNEAGILPSDI